MPDKDIFISSGPKNPDLKTSPFDLTYTNNCTGRFGQVNVICAKYLPPKSKISIKPYFAFDMMPLVFPIQTNVRCHLKFYRIPLRILHKDFEDFACQLGTDGLPTNTGSNQIVLPYIKRSTGWNAVGSLAEQIGCCNRRLVEKQGVLTLDGSFQNQLDYVDVSEDHNQMLERTDSTSIVIKLPDGFVPSLNRLRGVSYDSTFSFSLYAKSVQALSGAKLNVGVFVKSANNSFSQIASQTLDYVTSDSLYISSDLPVFYRSAASTETLDGHSVSKYVFFGKIPSSSVFYQRCNLAVAQGFEIYFVLSPLTVNLRNFMFPNVYFSRDHLLSEFSSITYTKLDSETGNLSSTESLQSVISRLGCSNSVDLAVMSVGSEITTIYDSVDGNEPLVPIKAFAFRAYEFIHNYFPEFRNPRVDPFTIGGKPTYNQFITNDSSGADTTTPVEHFNALYEVDYFTSCVKEPQFGNAPLVGVTVNDMSDTGILTFNESGTSNNYTVEIPIDKETGQALPITMYNDIADRPNVHRLQELISMGISVNDLRNVSTFQRMLERLQRAVGAGGSAYKNLMYEFFGTNPPIGDHYPVYIGGITRNLSVDKVTQQIDTEVQGKVKKAGEFTGQGYFRYPKGNEDVETISTFTTEPCLIMGIQYFTVTPTYSQFLPKHLLYNDPLDFYLDPDFAYIGPQPVYKKELAAAQLEDGHLDDVFGYNRPYAELFSNVDEVHGLFKTDMANFLLQRFFGSAPELNKSFIEINPNDLLNIFSVVQNTDKIYGQVLLKMHGEIPAPRSYQPRSI